MKVLFIAPLPPPVTGQSVAAEVFLNELRRSHFVKVVNFNKGTFLQGMSSVVRVAQVAKILKEIYKKSSDVDVIYLTISQSIAGNIKDIVTYLICFRNLSKMVIHLHGGGIRKLIFDKYRFLYHLNRILLKRLGGAIVLGESLIPIFEGMVPRNRMHVVPNFAEDYLFLNEEKIRKKFQNIDPLRILFLSNLILGKGHEELVEAYKALSDNLQKRIRIDFAGGFESDDSRRIFLSKIEGIKEINYHGIVSGDEKKKLFSGAHIFCLPTYYYYEGQPISILEAYPSGCVVITTDHGGICDIFKNEVNGFEVQKKSMLSIKEKIEQIVKKPEQLLPIALTNHQIACNEYRTSIYCSSLIQVLNEVGV